MHSTPSHAPHSTGPPEGGAWFEVLLQYDDGGTERHACRGVAAALEAQRRVLCALEASKGRRQGQSAGASTEASLTTSRPRKLRAIQVRPLSAAPQHGHEGQLEHRDGHDGQQGATGTEPSRAPQPQPQPAPRA